MLPALLTARGPVAPACGRAVSGVQNRAVCIAGSSGSFHEAGGIASIHYIESRLTSVALNLDCLKWILRLDGWLPYDRLQRHRGREPRGRFLRRSGAARICSVGNDSGSDLCVSERILWRRDASLKSMCRRRTSIPRRRPPTSVSICGPECVGVRTAQGCLPKEAP